MSEEQPDEETQADTSEVGAGAISDAQLPEDLQPTEDNPLARHPGQTGDEADKIGADTGGGEAGSPSASTSKGSDDSSDDET